MKIAKVTKTHKGNRLRKSAGQVLCASITNVLRQPAGLSTALRRRRRIRRSDSQGFLRDSLCAWCSSQDVASSRRGSVSSNSQRSVRDKQLPSEVASQSVREQAAARHSDSSHVIIASDHSRGTMRQPTPLRALVVACLTCLPIEAAAQGTLADYQRAMTPTGSTSASTSSRVTCSGRRRRNGKHSRSPARKGRRRPRRCGNE
jgi:hypothetical protein